MTQFIYKVNLKGKETSGIIEAMNVAEASQKLQEKGGYILMLRQRFSFGSLKLNYWVERFIASLSERMSINEKILFTIQLGAMLKTGLPIMEAIEAFIEDKPTGSSVVLKDIIDKLKRGKKLSKAMSAHPRVFDKVYVNVVRAGEEMGTLAETLVYLGEQLKREHNLTVKIRSAMIYPSVVFVAMIAVMTFIVFSVVPKINDFAKSSGVALPRVTQTMITLTTFLKQNWLGVMVVLIGVGFVGWQGIKTKKGKKLVDGLMLKTPVLGELVRRYNQVRFAYLLAGFYKYGISVGDAFDILAESLGNIYYSESCLRLKSKLTLGKSFSDALASERELFPSIMARIVKGAEQTGVLDETLRKLAKFYERELATALKNLTGLIEPLLIVLLGIGVLGIALSVILPIYRLTSQIR